MRICIYGGTFDPPHIGHMHACEAFLKKFSVDRMYIIPTSTPPHKIRVSTVSGIDRLEMCKLAFLGLSDLIEVSDVELKREGKSYTSDTIRYFKNKGNEEIYLLCGTDMMLTLDSWYNAEYILTNAKIVCMRREDDEETEKRLNKKMVEYREKYNTEAHILDLDAIELSSSEIRERIATLSINGLITDGVMEYITKKGLYRKE
ncbi:MAG: nicotinate (nicotinamide) nucleotide adenylyltransferase [Clostridia bacterium]|nr:nicotinate (nicotinamide) nucleotide adenylyltransferase [Clostridia bacterium]